jgi:hypothetical protein
MVCEKLIVRSGNILISTPEAIPHGLPKFVQLQRFHEDVVRSILFHLMIGQHIWKARDKYDGKVRSLHSSLHEQVDARLIFQSDVGNQEVDSFSSQLLQCTIDVPGRDHRTVLFPKEVPKRSENALVVINYQHRGLMWHDSYPHSSSPGHSKGHARVSMKNKLNERWKRLKICPEGQNETIVSTGSCRYVVLELTGNEKWSDMLLSEMVSPHTMLFHEPLKVLSAHFRSPGRSGDIAGVIAQLLFKELFLEFRKNHIARILEYC